MPGIHLNDTEKKLQNKWNTDAFKGTLRSISIGGDNGLRGLNNATINFNYPITVISGSNGSGKSTILALAALAYHVKEGFYAKGVKVNKKKQKGSHYTFKDFFFKGPKDNDFTGVNITWRYKDLQDKTITKRGTKKWMYYDTRPKRAVQFIGTSRIVCAIEQKKLRSITKIDSSKTTALTSEYMDYLGLIIHKNYTAAEELTSGDKNIRTCCTGTTYSSFNMGAGEDVAIELLSLLQRIPENALVVIEEIELGFHPEALKSLASILQKISLKKNLQFIISSHSADFIDALPRCARVLIQRWGDETKIHENPTTRFALGAMRSSSIEELDIICEDKIAESIILNAVSKDTRKRIRITPIGSKNELASAYEVLKKVNPNSKQLIVWDGDVTTADGVEYSSNIDSPNYIFLPSAVPPEKYLIRSIIDSTEALEFLSSRFSLESTNEVKTIINNAAIGLEHHNYIYKISQQVCLSTNEVISALIGATKIAKADDFSLLARSIEELLNNDTPNLIPNHNR